MLGLLPEYEIDLFYNKCHLCADKCHFTVTKMQLSINFQTEKFSVVRNVCTLGHFLQYVEYNFKCFLILINFAVPLIAGS